ncbi:MULTISPECIES: TonB-dependent receptor plug domain-containing protein [Ramlibacter]|uniref:TonB-dependent receptor plug domain-containing protein n=1 Tax=Ramlibacter aquaticus TaxID=2780094 RepID=A0ABR9SIC8_9BURK|nr:MULTISPECIES: TonB-dependent receptor plug domain-containing protein [Ramlibacter]MBE7941782.1 TonB-dependent receptor plug domain-containing protein [Ramlibacter aquaticus]
MPAFRPQRTRISAGTRALPWIATAALGCGGAIAQTPQDGPAVPPPLPRQALERVTVTGSNIKRTDVETAAPVTVITREELRRSGANTLGDVIANLGVAQGGLTGVEFTGFTPGAATVSLRGLGAGATLILINGRRIAPYGITGFQEVLTSVNSIPVSAIDRIDILKDGASAIYGSDAIAGVVNIIMRRDFNGIEAQLTHTDAHAALRNTRLGLAGGKGDLAADHYNLFAIFEHVDQAASVVADNRFYPSRNITGLTGQADQDFRSAYSVPGNLIAGRAVTTLPGTACAPRNVRTVGGNTRCVLDVFDYNTMAPRTQRDSLVSQATVELSASTTAFGEFNYSRGRYDYQFDPQFYYNGPGAVTLVPGAPYGLPGTASVLFRTGDIGARH